MSTENNDNDDIRNVPDENADEATINKYMENLGKKMDAYLNEYNGEYGMVRNNYEGFQHTIRYFSEFAIKNGGKIVDATTDPKELHSSFQIEIPMIDLFGSDLKEFLGFLKNADVIGITPSASDSLLIDITINNVYQRLQR